MPRNSPKCSRSLCFHDQFELMLLVQFEFSVSFELILRVSFEFSVSFELILWVPFEFSVSLEVILCTQGPVSELKHIYCQNRLAACCCSTTPPTVYSCNEYRHGSFMQSCRVENKSIIINI